LALEDKSEGIWFAEAFVIADEEALMSAASFGVRLFIITPTIAPLSGGTNMTSLRIAMLL
jgi:hypothetical protein